MRIVTLIENLVNTSGLVAEHGLSIYIETDKRKILFDTGQSGLFLQNAKKLGISMEEVDAVVLSHGHYDHTGGLYSFLEINRKAKVYCKRGVFAPKYKGETTFIGTHYNENLLKDRLVYVDEVTQLDKTIFLMPNTPIIHQIDTHFKEFYSKTGEDIMPDKFNDELFIALNWKNKINLLTACSHRGITNICEEVKAQFHLPIRLILGGFHMKSCSTEQYVHITHYFRNLKPKTLGICHCTGIEKYADLRRECDISLFYNDTGNTIVLKD